MDKNAPEQLTTFLPLIRKYIAKLKNDHLPIQEVFVFGSRAKGTAQYDSDIDLCVISTSFENRDKAIDYLWSKRDREETLAGLEPLGYNPKDFVDEDPMVWEIKSTGIRIE